MLEGLIQKKNPPPVSSGSTKRLSEMVHVLRTREIVRGITPLKMRQILEDLGPTFVKLGQVMSMRPDFLPPVVFGSSWMELKLYLLKKWLGPFIHHTCPT